MCTVKMILQQCFPNNIAEFRIFLLKVLQRRPVSPPACSLQNTAEEVKWDAVSRRPVHRGHQVTSPCPRDLARVRGHHWRRLCSEVTDLLISLTGRSKEYRTALHVISFFFLNFCETCFVKLDSGLNKMCDDENNVF